MALIKCPECNQYISDKATNCPHCGCPIEKEEEPEHVNIAAIVPGPERKISKRAKITITIFIIIAAFCVASGIVTRYRHIEAENSEQEKKDADLKKNIAEIEYDSKLKIFLIDLRSGQESGEKAADLMYDTWNNTIWKIDDKETDKFTKDSNGEFYTDFNDAITQLYKKSDDFQANYQMLKYNNDSVDDSIKDLQSPPEKYEKAYSDAQQAYALFKQFAKHILDPSGETLNSFKEKYDQLDSDLSKQISIVDSYTSADTDEDNDEDDDE